MPLIYQYWRIHFGVVWGSFSTTRFLTHFKGSKLHHKNFPIPSYRRAEHFPHFPRPIHTYTKLIKYCDLCSHNYLFILAKNVENVFSTNGFFSWFHKFSIFVIEILPIFCLAFFCAHMVLVMVQFHFYYPSPIKYNFYWKSYMKNNNFPYFFFSLWTGEFLDTAMKFFKTITFFVLGSPFHLFP